jgi:transcriptional regulator with XRE-family HTH domain
MEQLKEFRKSLGLTVSEFANEIKVSKSLYEKVENRFRKPSREFMTKLKRRFPQFDTNIFFLENKITERDE